MMPLNSSLDMLRRWQALDRALSRELLIVRVFAKKWKTSERTIRRDLDTFKRLGQRIIRRYEWEMSEHYYQYESGVRCLFTCNLHPAPK